MDTKQLYTWCNIPADQLENHSDKRIPFRIMKDSNEMGEVMARDFVEEIKVFSDETVEYPMTLLQKHPDVLITATYDTACHPISENPDWEFKGINA